jgi:hypothetical protein
MPRLLAPVLLAAAIALAMVLPGGAAGADAPTAVPAGAAAPVSSLPSAGQIDAYLSTKGSPMTGQGAAFVASGGRWQLDPRLLVAIAGAESSFGQITCAPFNAWGWGCPNGPFRFESWADGIDTVAEGLRTNYLSEGRTTVALINLKYAPIGAENDPTGLNSNWTINVSRFLVEQGGDPNDVDLDGIAGTMPLGPLGGASLDSFGFTEEADRDAAATQDPDAPALEVAAGEPRALVVRVRNSGYVAWRTRDVRLRRVDSEPRVAGAPFGALANATAVEPGSVAEFVVQLAAVGSSDGIATTIWRLEGPSGPFGNEISRTVAFAVPAFVVAEPRVEVTPTNAGIAGGMAWTVVVHVRNGGSQTWTRDGDDGVLIGLVDAAGRPHGADGWINPRVAARMLEREAAPGEEASFAFRVSGSDGGGTLLAMRPFRADGWATGDVAYVQLGNVAAPLRTQLEARIDAD